MCVLVPQDPEKVRWLAQQTSPAKKGYSTVRRERSRGWSFCGATSSRKVPCCKGLRHLSSESPILALPLSRRHFPICPTPQIQSHVVAVWAPQTLFFSCVHVSPRPSCRSANKKLPDLSVARFETKAITSPRLLLRPSLSNFLCHLFRPGPPYSHHPPHFASRTPDLPLRILRHYGQVIGLPMNFQKYYKICPLTCNAPPLQ